MAKPSYPRARRLAETIRRLAGEWLEAEQADQPVALVTVTDVRVTEDLHHASVFFTVLGDDQARAAAEAWLASSATGARTFVASQLRLRHAPTLEFVPDTVPGQGARIDRLLAELGRAGGVGSGGVRRVSISEQDWQAAVDAIAEAEVAVISCHIHPDGDALGSALALHRALANAGREAVVSFSEPFVVARHYRFLAGLDRLVPPDQVPTDADLFVCFDAGSLDRLGSLVDAFRGAARTLVVDHHASNTRFGDVNLIDAGLAGQRRALPRAAPPPRPAPRHRDRHRPLHRAGHRHRPLPVPGDHPRDPPAGRRAAGRRGPAVRGGQGRVRDQRHRLPAAGRRHARPHRPGPGGVAGLDQGRPGRPGRPRGRHGRDRGPDRPGPHRRRQRRGRRAQAAAGGRLQGLAALQGRHRRRQAGHPVRRRRAQVRRRLLQPTWTPRRRWPPWSPS